MTSANSFLLFRHSLLFRILYCVLNWWLSAWHKPCQHIQIWEGATLSLCQKSCFLNALGRSWASLVCAQAAQAQINDYLPTFLAILAQLWAAAGCCPVSNFPVQKAVGSCEEALIYLSLACAVTAHGQKPAKDRRYPGIWQCYFTLVSALFAVCKGTWLNLLYILGIITRYFIHINKSILCCTKIYCTKQFLIRVY